MTNEELLQQCKDEVARDFKDEVHPNGYADWGEVVKYARLPDWHTEQIEPCDYEELMYNATMLAIQKAREEGWTNVDDDNLPERGEQILLLCPRDDKKGFYQCVGFYARRKEYEVWVDDDNIRGIDYDKESQETYLMPGFYTEEEQYRGECDSHYFERHPVKWKKLTAPGR